MSCYRDGGCGPYEMLSCSLCPASKPDYKSRKKQRPLTNYDKLISKSPEELAEWLHNINLISHDIGIPKEWWLIWLRQNETGD